MDFVVPKVRGLLYDIEFIKVDSDGNPLQNAEFTISGTTGAGQSIDTILENDAVAASDANGYVKFRNMPWGTYTITETKVPDGYTGAAGLSDIILCYTTHSKLLAQDHNIVDDETHTCDQQSDIKNMLYIMRNLPNDGKIVNIKNTPEYELPSTGGNGISMYTISGIILMIATALILYKNKCREVLNK